MAHQCETIVAAIVTLLKAGGTDAGTRVYRGRTVPPEAAEGDVILVYEGEEDSSHLDVNGLKDRYLDVAVELHKRATVTDVNDPTAIETAMNDFYREAEVALEASYNLSGTCQQFQHVFTRRERNGDGDQETRCLTLGLRVHYRTLRTNPEVQG